MNDKPEWKDAPYWAQWLAADLTINAARPERWVWFELKPYYHGCGWMCEGGQGKWLQTESEVPLLFDAKNSLEARPK